MKKTNWYNHKGELFRIKISDFEKIEQYGSDAGKYLTFNKDINAWELTDIHNEFNADRTWKYMYKYEDNYGKVDTYDVIAWSLGYIHSKE